MTDRKPVIEVYRLMELIEKLATHQCECEVSTDGECIECECLEKFQQEAKEILGHEMG